MNFPFTAFSAPLCQAALHDGACARRGHRWDASREQANPSCGRQEVRERSILQTALAACLAWFLAVLILGLERPTFAPIAAVIVLGLAVSERARRAVELTLAVAFGVAMADLLLSVVGVGALQAGVFVVLAMGLAVFLGGGNLGVNEATISAMIIMFTFTPSAASFPIERARRGRCRGDEGGR